MKTIEEPGVQLSMKQSTGIDVSTKYQMKYIAQIDAV